MRRLSLLIVFQLITLSSQKGTWWYEAALLDEMFSCKNTKCSHGGKVRVILQNLAGDTRFHCRCQCTDEWMGDNCELPISNSMKEAIKYIKSTY